MKKDEFIEMHGDVAYERKLKQSREWEANHPEAVIMKSREQYRRGGKYYEKHRRYQRTGFQGVRNTVRSKHGRMWRKYKNIIAPDSQVHHQWIPETAKYKGVALVEANAHMHGFIDVIQILDGEITGFTEKELRERGDL